MLFLRLHKKNFFLCMNYFTARFFVNNSIVVFDNTGKLVYASTDIAKKLFNKLQMYAQIDDFLVNDVTGTIAVVYTADDLYQLWVYAYDPQTTDPEFKHVYTWLADVSCDELVLTYNHGTNVGFYTFSENVNKELALCFRNVSTTLREVTSEKTYKTDTTQYLDVSWNFVPQSSSDLSDFVTCFAHDNKSKTFAVIHGMYNKDNEVQLRHGTADTFYGIHKSKVINTTDITNEQVISAIKNRYIHCGPIELKNEHEQMYRVTSCPTIDGATFGDNTTNFLRVEQNGDTSTLLSDNDFVWLYDFVKGRISCVTQWSTKRLNVDISKLVFDTSKWYLGKREIVVENTVVDRDFFFVNRITGRRSYNYKSFTIDDDVDVFVRCGESTSFMSVYGKLYNVTLNGDIVKLLTQSKREYTVRRAECENAGVNHNVEILMSDDVTITLSHKQMYDLCDNGMGCDLYIEDERIVLSVFEID